jgi:hypothetical protein
MRKIWLAVIGARSHESIVPIAGGNSGKRDTSDGPKHMSSEL